MSNEQLTINNKKSSMDKTYTFKDNQYKLRELDLNLLHKASPLLIKYRELHYKYTAGIDTSKLDAAQNEITQIKEAARQLDESEDPGIEQQIHKLKVNLEKAEEVLRSPKLTALQKYLGDTEALVLFEIITDAGFMAEVLNNILRSTDEKEKTKIKTDDLLHKNSLKLIKEVITDFFLLTLKNS